MGYFLILIIIVVGVFYLRNKIKKHEQNNNLTSNNIDQINKSDFGQKEIKSKKLYQSFEQLLQSLKGGNTQTIAGNIQEYLKANYKILGDNQFMIATELVEMIILYKKDPQNNQVTPEKIKKIIHLLKETIIAETNFTAVTFEKVKIK